MTGGSSSVPLSSSGSVESSAAAPVFLGSSTTAALLGVAILLLIYFLAFISRLYSVLRYESVIHEFDPWFNYRTTRVLVSQGFYNFLNWFDDRSWYPLGRIVGGTVFPGLMLTAGMVHNLLHTLHITVDIRNVCVLLAPWFASNTSLATYFLTKEVKSSGAGLVAAAFIAIVPAYISRSVAGSYDNEGVAIFALVFTFFLWLKAVNTGSILWSCACALSYFYMVAAWGGYVFITNLIPLYVFAMLMTGRYSNRVYVAYSIFYILGTLLAMQVKFVGFQAVQSSEHFASLGVFGLLQIHGFINWIRSLLKPQTFKSFIKFSFVVIGVLLVVGLRIASTNGMISPWTGRFYSMFDPTYAKENIPIIASVSEHQPTIWVSFFMDLHFLIWLMPVGLYFCFQNLTDAKLFVLCYGVSAIYFAGVMVRLMLVLAPIACVLGGIAISSTLEKHLARNRREKPGDYQVAPDVSAAIVIAIGFFFVMYTMHCTFITSEAYSSPSIVLAVGSGNDKAIWDDFRESYRWLAQNTAPDARIMSWWDYGYQIAGMANRTVIVDNNTWNNTHIASVGRAMASTEEEAYPIMLKLDVDYVLVIFGGKVGYSGDDINKFMWMVRIAGGVWPHIKESNYYNAKGEFRMDEEGSPAMLESVVYKTSFYRFSEVEGGMDRVRKQQITRKVQLEHLEEVYTSEHWLVRIYKVKPPNNHRYTRIKDFP